MKLRGSRTWYAAIACAVFLACTYLGDLMRLCGVRRLIGSGWLFVGAYKVAQVVFCISGIMTAHRAGIRRALGEIGLRASFSRAATFAFIAASPMLIAFALTSRLNPKMSIWSVSIGCIIGPFAEEVLFRGYVFGQLYRRARWGFWLSALVPSALFALGHAYQAHDRTELTGIFAVTGLGSLLGCWMYLRWNGNLWAVFGLHALMNLWWEVFGVSETALGGWLANGARLLTIVIAVLLTIYRHRIWRPQPNEPNWREEQRQFRGRNAPGERHDCVLPLGSIAALAFGRCQATQRNSFGLGSSLVT